MYRIIGNNTLTDPLNVDSQWWDDQTTQHLILKDSSYFKFDSDKIEGPGGLYVRNW